MPCAADSTSRGRPSGVACAFSASLSQRSPKLRRSAASSGELANFARRAHSAAWALQYFTYDDITRSRHMASAPHAVSGEPFPRSARDPREYSRRHVTEQGANPPGLQFCGGLLRRRHTSADKPSLSFRDPPSDARWVEPESTPVSIPRAWTWVSPRSPPTG